MVVAVAACGSLGEWKKRLGLGLSKRVTGARGVENVPQARGANPADEGLACQTLDSFFTHHNWVPPNL
jgi:hypothetical protein